MDEMKDYNVRLSAKSEKELDKMKIKDKNNFELTIQSTTSDPSSLTINSLHLNSETLTKRDDIADTSFSLFGGWITNTIIPKKSFGGNIDVLIKSESLDTNTNFPDFDNPANLPFTIPFCEYSAENPLLSSKLFIARGMFSSSKNFGESDIAFSTDELGSIFECSRNMLPCDRRIVFQNIFNRFACCDHFNNITNHNSGAFKSRLSMADFAVRNNIIVNFNSHERYNASCVFKIFCFGEDKLPIESELAVC